MSILFFDSQSALGYILLGVQIRRSEAGWVKNLAPDGVGTHVSFIFIKMFVQGVLDQINPFP